MKKIILSLLFAVLGFALTPQELAVDVNYAGKERMLTQKITKDVFLIALGEEKAKEDLQKSRNEFERILYGLIEGDSELGLTKITANKKALQQAEAIKKKWLEFRKHIDRVLDGDYTQEDLNYIKNHNLELLQEANKLVELLVALNPTDKTENAQAINLAGKCRMLSQRIAKDVLILKKYPQESLTDLKRTIEELDLILDALENGNRKLGVKKTSAPWIQQELKKAREIWAELKKEIQNPQDVKKIVQLSDQLLAQMDKITKMYEAIVNKGRKIRAIKSIVEMFEKEKELQKHIINLAGKQRMLTQKMTKEALLTAIGYDPTSNIKLLKEDMELFDRTLHGFLYGDKGLNLPAVEDKKVKEEIVKVVEVWKPFKKEVENFIKTQDKNSLNYLVANNMKLLERSNNLVQAFKKAFPSYDFLEEARKEIVDIAGRQRMLTQKMTKEKLLVMLDIEKEKNRQNLKETIELFETSLNDLLNGNKKRKIVRPTNKKVIAQLKKVNSLWKDLKPIYLKEKLSQKEMDKLVEGNVKLLKEMDKAVLLTERVVDY